MASNEARVEGMSGTAATLPSRSLGVRRLQARLERHADRSVGHQAPHRQQRGSLGDTHQRVGRVVQTELAATRPDELHHVGGAGGHRLRDREAAVLVVALGLGDVDGDVEHPRHPVHDQLHRGHLGRGRPGVVGGRFVGGGTGRRIGGGDAAAELSGRVVVDAEPRPSSRPAPASPAPRPTHPIASTDHGGAWNGRRPRERYRPRHQRPLSFWVSATGRRHHAKRRSSRSVTP